MGWVRDDFPDHEGVVVALVRREGCRPETSTSIGSSRSDRCRCQSAASTPHRRGLSLRVAFAALDPGRPATYGPFSRLADVEDEERAYQLWERHSVLDVGGDRVKRPMKLATTVPTPVAALLNNHRALAGATDDERRRLAHDLEAAITALGPSGSRATGAALLNNHGALAGATADELCARGPPRPLAGSQSIAAGSLPSSGSVFPKTAGTGAIDSRASSTVRPPKSPACRISSTPSSARSASLRTSPCVSAMSRILARSF
jgi:hypothetical protein